MSYPRLIDGYLEEWVSRETHKPLLLRGARQPDFRFSAMT